MQAAVVKALEKDPIRQKGEWCRFAPCKLTCPLWTGPMLDLATMGAVPKRTEFVAKEITPYAEYLANAKALVDLLAFYTKEVNEQLHAYLEDGGVVPGWRLKAKIKQRQWVDPAIVVKALEKLGFESEEIFQTKLQTFQSTDATAKRRGVRIPDELRVAPPSNETTVCTSDDPAPPVERGLVVEQFAAALAALAAPPKG
jgi:tRNA G26 N,N-dimethylase Trm1